MGHNVQGTYISEKINKIRWRPDAFNNCHSFITGSWDEEYNKIKLWDFQEKYDSELYPVLFSELLHKGDVTEALFIDSDSFACSSSIGSVGLFKICYKEYEIGIEESIQWKDLHKFQNDEISACNAITVYDQDIVSVGEDGRINLLTLTSKSPVRTYDDADSCSIKCVLFLKHNEILTSNLRGQIKIWDLRLGNNKPSNTFVLSGDLVAPTCLTYHPTQRHLVVAGDEEGSITIWDLRHNTYPINLLRAHEESVTEIHFHSDYPDHLFSASNSGELWYWSMKPKPVPLHALSSIEEVHSSTNDNMWYASDSFKSELEVFTLMDKLRKPINSFDVNQMKVICGCDNEAVFLINDINLHNF